MSKLTYYIIIVLSSFSQLCYATQADIASELNDYINTFSTDSYATQRSAIEPLSWSGISDPKLYDLIEAKLLETYLVKGKVASEKGSWFAKALALSGNEKYRATLENVAKNARSKKVRKYSKLALRRLSKYAQWNPVISSGLDQAPSGKLKEARVKNMLQAKDPKLNTIGAKRLYYAHSIKPELMKIAHNRLLKSYADVNTDEEIDAMAWMIKALSKSGDTSNRNTLRKIVESAKSKKLRKYAKKYINYL